MITELVVGIIIVGVVIYFLIRRKKDKTTPYGGYGDAKSNKSIGKL